MNRFYLLLGGAALVGVAVFAYILTRKAPVSIPVNAAITVTDTSGFRGYTLGDSNAPIEVTEYADFECHACQQWTAVQFPSIEERLIRTGKVRWRYRDFPIDGAHRYARIAAHAAACANDQDKYWEVNKQLYSWEPAWPESRDPVSIFRGYAQKAGMDVAAYDACMSSGKYAGRIQASQNEGISVGVGSTPTFLVNGQLYQGNRSMTHDVLKAMVDSLSAAKPASN
jgi:protein-disulfide isomerase